MQAFKTTIHILVPVIQGWRSKPFTQYLQWYIDNADKEAKKPSIEETSRKQLLRILKDLHDQIITETTEKIFKDAKLAPPYSFTQVRLSKAATNSSNTDEYIVSGIGDPQSLVDWLKLNKFSIEVRRFNI
jgi:hypothetical protein